MLEALVLPIWEWRGCDQKSVAVSFTNFLLQIGIGYGQLEVVQDMMPPLSLLAAWELVGGH